MAQTIRLLTRAISSGDTEAFADFYEQYFDWMYAEARRVTRCDESFCLDVVQETMMKIIRSIRSMETEEDLKRWLRVVVRSCALDQLRALSRRRRHESAAAVVDKSANRDCPHEQIAWLRKEMRNLDPASALLLSLRHRWGWTLKRIGAALQLSSGAVDGRLTRLYRKLRQRAVESFDD